jgi:hydrogenase/urease accessory protein HupE
MRPPFFLALLALVAFALLFAPARARAHAVGASRGEYTMDGAVLRAEATFARGDLVAVVPSLDPDADGRFDGADVVAARGALAKAMAGGVAVRADGAPCAGAFDGARLVEEDGVTLAATYTCGSRPARLEIELRVLNELPRGHRHLAHVTMGTPAGPVVIDEVASAAHDIVALALPPAAGASPVPARAVERANGLLLMGIEHILTGYDHLVFLFGLVLVAGRVRSFIAAVTAFTAAHSITLALAALDVCAPPPRVVEALIALSIVYVGVENLIVASADRRWRITFPFGLVHGFGFAGALRAIDLPRAQIPRALVQFNLGVEMGQLAVLCVALPVVFALRRRGALGPRVGRALSGAVVVVGGLWFIERVWRG